MKQRYILILVIAAFVIGGLLCRPDRSGEAAQHRADSLATVVDSLKQFDERRAADSAAAADTTLRLKTALVIAARHGAATQRSEDLLRATLDAVADTMVPKRLVQELVDTLDSMIHIREAQRDTALRLFAISERQRVQSDSAAREWRLAAARLQSELAASLKRSNSRYGCTAGAGAAIGYQGYAAGFGFTCGRTFRLPKIL